MMLWFFLFFLGCSTSIGAAEAPVIEHSLALTPAPVYHVVRVGDTLYSIAWMYRLDYRDLISYNHLRMPYVIHIGQSLQIKPTQTQLVPVAPVVFENQPLGRWRWPVKGRIRTGFSSAPLGNKGIDFVGPFQAPVYATADGQVVYSGAGIRGYGNLLIIKHSQDYWSAYAFNWRNLAKEGETVHAGQQIATMGRDNSRHVLLHFEVRYKGVPVDPLRYLCNPQG